MDSLPDATPIDSLPTFAEAGTLEPVEDLLCDVYTPEQQP